MSAGPPHGPPAADIANAVTCTGLDGCACPTCRAGEARGRGRVDLAPHSPEGPLGGIPTPRAMLTTTEPPACLAGGVTTRADVGALLARGVETGSDEDVLAAAAALSGSDAGPAPEGARARVLRLMHEGAGAVFAAIMAVDAPRIPRAKIADGLVYMRDLLSLVVARLPDEEVARLAARSDESIREEAAEVARGAMAAQRPS